MAYLSWPAIVIPPPPSTSEGIGILSRKSVLQATRADGGQCSVVSTVAFSVDDVDDDDGDGQARKNELIASTIN